MAMEHKSMFYFVMVLALMVAGKSFTEAQIANPPSCGLKLQSCLAFLNSTQPPLSCCIPLKEVLENELACICSIYNNPGVLQSVGLNSTTADELTVHCRITGTGFGNCKNALAPPPSQVKNPAPTSPTGTTGGDSGGSSRMAYAGVASFVLMCWTSLMLC